MFESEIIYIEISETLIFFYTILDKKKARKKLKKIVKNVSEQKYSKAIIIIEKIREQRNLIAESERKERYKKYIEDIYSSASVLQRMPEIKNEYLSKIKKIEVSLKQAFKLVPKKIEYTSEIEKCFSDLAAIARNARSEVCYNSTIFKYYKSPNNFDFEYWYNKEYKIGQIYILSNPYMPGLVKIGLAVNSAVDRAYKLSNGKGEKDKILKYLLNEHEFIYRPDIIASALSKITGVPGDFKVEYHRLTILDYPVQWADGQSYNIEKIIHKAVSSKSYGQYEWGEENFEPDIIFIIVSVALIITFPISQIFGL